MSDFVVYHAPYLGDNLGRVVASGLDGFLEDGYLVRGNQSVVRTSSGQRYPFVKAEQRLAPGQPGLGQLFPGRRHLDHNINVLQPGQQFLRQGLNGFDYQLLKPCPRHCHVFFPTMLTVIFPGCQAGMTPQGTIVKHFWGCYDAYRAKGGGSSGCQFCPGGIFSA